MIRKKISACRVAKNQTGRREERAIMNLRFGLWMATTAMAVVGVTGCATKNWVHTQTAPIIDHTGQLEDKTAANGRAIHDTDDRAQAGIKQAQGAADSATQNAQTATKSAGDAETAANDAVHRADSLDSVVKGLDNYKPLANATVNFGFDKAMLTKDDKDQLDSFAGQLSSAKSYILEVTGGTDSTGPAQYNYDLSQRRGAVPGGEVQHPRAPLLFDRDWQGQCSGRQHDGRWPQAESPRADSAAVEHERRSANCASNACAFGIGQLSQRKNGRQRAGHPERFRMALPFWCAKTCYEVAV
jgi:outer membrane protein OmpA-like peptidoglycan-associated protein